MNETEQAVQAAARMIAKAALELFVHDQHRWGERPCQTCRQITSLIGESFGCIKYAEQFKSSV